MHIGIHKTATTSIQRTLYHNRQNKYFKQNGYFYPSHWGGANHIMVHSLLSDKPELYPPHKQSKANIEQIREFNNNLKLKLIAELSKDSSDTIIFSSEEFVNVIINQRLILKLDNLLKELFGSEIKIQVIAFVRNPIDRFCSWYQQVMRTNFWLSYNDFESVIAQNEMHYKAISEFARFFGKENIKVYKFEETLGAYTSPVAFFFHEVLNFSEAEYKTIDEFKDNSSSSQIALDIASFVNGFTPKNSKDEWIKQNREFRDLMPIYTNLTGPKFTLDKASKYRCLKLCQPIINYLMEFFAIEYDLDSLKQQIDDSCDPVYIPSKKNLEELKDIYPTLTPFIQLSTIKYLQKIAENLVFYGIDHADLLVSINETVYNLIALSNILNDFIIVSDFGLFPNLPANILTGNELLDINNVFYAVTFKGHCLFLYIRQLTNSSVESLVSKVRINGTSLSDLFYEVHEPLSDITQITVKIDAVTSLVINNKVVENIPRLDDDVILTNIMKAKKAMYNLQQNNMIIL